MPFRCSTRKGETCKRVLPWFLSLLLFLTLFFLPSLCFTFFIIPKGPKGEIIGALMQPLPAAYLIFRATSEANGKQWMEAIELSFRASSLLVRNSISGNVGAGLTPGSGGQRESFSFQIHNPGQDDGSPPPSATLKLNESEIEKHFKDHGEEGE